MNINYEKLFNELCLCKTKRDVVEAVTSNGIETSTTATLTQNEGDLYFQLEDGSRIHFEKTVIRLLTSYKISKSLYFNGTEFKDVKDGSYRVKQAVGERSVETLKKFLGYFYSVDNAEEAEHIAQDIFNSVSSARDVDAVVKVRVGQGTFRDLLLQRYSKCCLCGVSEPTLLRASHIKPWSKADSSEKLDCDNGFLMCPNHDALFDKGWISFDDAGNMLISSKLAANDRIFLNVSQEKKIELTDGNRRYLAYHRENIFQDK